MIWKPFPKQEKFLASPAYEALFGGTKGPGKEMPLDSLICTPFGFKRMGDIKIGDQLSNPDGSVSRVIGVYPQGVKDIYKVTFDDGASCEVGLDHLWNIKIVGRTRFRKRGAENRPTPWSIATTGQIMSRLADGKRVLIPLSEPVEFTVSRRSPLPIEAYELGASIADGSIAKDGVCTVCTPDESVISQFKTLQLSNKYQQEGNKAIDYRFQRNDAFVQLGLSGKESHEKFIPECYKRSPLSVRWQLIRGLMDSDGTADKSGASSYSTSSEQLAKDVQWVARSLGFKSNILSKIPTYTYKGQKLQGRNAYNVCIKGDEHSRLFSLERKKVRASKPYNGGNGFRTRKIVSVAFSRKTEAQCIKVDHPNGLYITDDFIVTHNTDCLLMEATREVKNPNFRGIIFRRTYPRLGEVIDRSFKYFNGWATFSLKDQKLGLPAWTWPSGAKLAFGHVQHETDKFNYQGRQFSYIAIDEVEEFLESVYLFLMAQNRTSDPALWCRIRASANPGGIGHLWVKNRFIDKCPDGIVKHFKLLDEEDIECEPHDPNALSRAFYFATLYDNPALTNNDPLYVKRLEQLPENERRALLHGDWEVFAGQFFQWKPNYHIKERPIIAEFRKFCGLDYGYAKQSAVVWCQVDFDGRIHVYRELYMPGLTYQQLAKMVMEMTPANENIEYISADPAIWGDRTHHKDSDDGESGGEMMQKILENFTSLRKGDNDRLVGWGRVREYLNTKETAFGQQAWLTFSPSCKHCIRTIPSLVHDETRVEDCNSDGEDHLADALRMALMSRPLHSTKEDTLKPKMFSPEWYVREKEKITTPQYALRG